MDKLDVDKLVLVPIDLSKLSNVVKNHAFKNNAKVQSIVNKILDITNLALTLLLMLKREAKYEIPSNSNLVTTTALNAVKNKILNVSNLVKKTDYNKNQ